MKKRKYNVSINMRSPQAKQARLGVDRNLWPVYGRSTSLSAWPTVRHSSFKHYQFSFLVHLSNFIKSNLPKPAAGLEVNRRESCLIAHAYIRIQWNFKTFSSLKGGERGWFAQQSVVSTPFLLLLNLNGKLICYETFPQPRFSLHSTLIPFIIRSDILVVTSKQIKIQN